MDRSLEGYSPWDHQESDMTEQLTHTLLNLGGGYKGVIFFNLSKYLKSSIAAVPNLFDTRDWFCGGQFFHSHLGDGVEDGLGLIQVHYFYCALYFFITSAPCPIIKH